MHFAKNIITLSALLAMCSGSVVKRADNHGLAARDTISIVVTDNRDGNGLIAKAQPGVHAATDCDPNLCSEACYQHGAGAGGKCDDKGQCVCNKPHVATHLYNQVPTGNQGPSGDDVHTNNLCDTYADCSSCWFYERCCMKQGGNTSTEKGTCVCGVSGREGKCA